MSSSRNDAFWKLIDEVETSSLLLGREDCTEYQRRREAARRKLEEWLEAADDEKADAVTNALSDAAMEG